MSVVIGCEGPTTPPKVTLLTVANHTEWMLEVGADTWSLGTVQSSYEETWNLAPDEYNLTIRTEESKITVTGYPQTRKLIEGFEHRIEVFNEDIPDKGTVKFVNEIDELLSVTIAYPDESGVLLFDLVEPYETYYFIVNSGQWLINAKIISIEKTRFPEPGLLRDIKKGDVLIIVINWGTMP